MAADRFGWPLPRIRHTSIAWLKLMLRQPAPGKRRDDTMLYTADVELFDLFDALGIAPGEEL